MCTVMFWVCNPGLLNDNRKYIEPLLQLVEALDSETRTQQPPVLPQAEKAEPPVR